MENYFFNLYQSFQRIKGLPLTVLTIILGIIAFNFRSTDTLPLSTVLTVGIISFIILAVVIDNSIHNFKKASNILPKVKIARPPTSLYNEAKAILVIEDSDIFGHETMVSVYYLEEGYERLIGVGFILTIQGNGLIQVLVTKGYEEQADNIWDRICKNDIRVLSKLHIKPSIPKILNDLGA